MNIAAVLIIEHRDFEYGAGIRYRVAIIGNLAGWTLKHISQQWSKITSWN